MTVTTMAAPAMRRRSAMTPAHHHGAEAVHPGRAAVGLGLSAGVPLLLVIIFGGIHSFNTPVRKYGGLTTLDVYVPILLVFAMAPAVARGHAGDAGRATGSWGTCAG